MRVAIAVLTLLLTTVSIHAQQEVLYLDQLMEMPLASLQQQFPKLRKEGCYQIAADRFLWIDMDKRDRKPWRVAISSSLPCKRAENGPALDVRERAGIDLGESTVKIVEKMGRPDASAAPEAPLRKLGETEYFYICRVSEGCARHTSVFVRDGIVTAIAEWYSE